MPPHNLLLKIGSPIMLLRNLDAPRPGNGTRVCVKSLMAQVIEATILFIPQIPMVPTDMPFEFKRLQFPVRLALAMSINKAQEQSLRAAGIHLETPCFSNGQLYVACSRVETRKNLYVFALDGERQKYCLSNSFTIKIVLHCKPSLFNKRSSQNKNNIKKKKEILKSFKMLKKTENIEKET